jgi:hypothetical protein
VTLQVDKLRHVLRHAIRDLLVKHGVTNTAVRTAGTQRLIDLVLGTSGITQAELDSLYEEYRYGTRPTIYLYLLPSTSNLSFDPSQMQGAYDDVRADELDQENSQTPSQDDEQVSRDICVEDVETFDGITEIHLTYVHQLQYIDTDDNPASVEELRHAFLWVSTGDHFVAVLARDQSIARPSVRALTKVLGVAPARPILSDKAWERILRSEDAARVRLLDSDGIGRNYSGIIRANTEAQARVRLEVDERRRSGDQMRGALYREIIDGRVGALGISATSASLFVTLTLSLTQLRAWVKSRLMPLIQAIQRDAATQPRITSDMYSLKGIARSQRKAVRDIVVAGLTARIMNRPSSNLTEPVSQLIQALGQQLRLYLMAPCARCGGAEEVYHCRNCGGAEVQVDGDAVTCVTCQRDTELVCELGHELRASPSDWLLAVPVDSLRRALIGALGSTAQLDPERGYLVIWNETVWVGNTASGEDRTITFNISGQARAAVNLDSPGASIRITSEKGGTDNAGQEDHD